MCSTPEPVQVTDPADSEFGAGAGPNFDGHRQAARTFRQSAGVVEGRPGIIESTHIDPLSETSNEGAFLPPPLTFLPLYHIPVSNIHTCDSTDDGWANATQPTGRTGSGAGTGGLAQGAYDAASGVATGAMNVARSAYEFVAGDEKARRSGKEGSA